MVRAPCSEKMGLKKGAWTSEEDQVLISFINKYGHGNWRALPKQAGLLRCGKSCRLRWINYLRPDIKRGSFTKEEEDAIINLHEMLGNRWSAIAARLPGRTDNEIKNVWHTHLKKKLNKNSPNLNGQKPEIILTKDDFSEKRHQTTRITSTASTTATDRLEPTTSNMSSQSSSSDLSSFTEEMSLDFDRETNDNRKVASIKDEITSAEYRISGSDTNYFSEIDESFWSEALSAGENLNASYTKMEHDMEFWYDVFIRTGGSPELPEF